MSQSVTESTNTVTHRARREDPRSTMTPSATTASHTGGSNPTILKPGDQDDSVASFFATHSWMVGLLWPLMVSVPWLLSSPHSPLSYKEVFPEEWYTQSQGADASSTPKPLGLLLGILSVIVGQLFVWIFFYMYKYDYNLLELASSSLPTLTAAAAEKQHVQPPSIQSIGARPYDYTEGVMTHIGQPEGFVLLIAYLASTWMFRLMPKSYYDFDGTIEWNKLAFCLVLQDGIQFSMHLLEHVASPKLYQMSHKPHHRFTNPRLFDAFNGSLADTLCMIILPLYITANVVHCNVWTYMAFGTAYSSWLTLIHSEYVFPWDPYFRMFGLGTPADHHVHHKYFKYNYGHLFLWFDRLAGTYRDPKDCSVFRPGV